MRPVGPPPCRIRPMLLEDISQVVEIERQSFPSMWSRTVYERELKNNLARYLVAYQPAETGVGAAVVPRRAPPPGLAGLVRSLFGGSPARASGDRILGLVGLWLMVGQAHVVTANKGPAAFAFHELEALAESVDRIFFFEGAVMDGV
ncbi:MAG: hypothetical protein U1B78_08015, partial [Dehalococcoidia bacterium]|nr:hypothetical protein [Dehalococcoidia bacterium]